MNSQNTQAKVKNKHKLSKVIGIILVSIEILASVVFVLALLQLNMLPTKYVMVLVGLLTFMSLLLLFGQVLSKRNAITGKIISVILSILLLVSAYYLLEAGNAVKEISGDEESVKLDRIVVAVKEDDIAHTIEEAKNYQFGVQYSMKAEDIKQAVVTIEAELDSSIAVTEYSDMSEQVKAFHDGEVDAIIYNEAYTGIFEEVYDTYNNDVKIIYIHDIETIIKNTAVEVEVKKNPFIVYISGIDVFGPISTNSRSDVNIMAVVNPETHQVLLVTTQRDYYVKIPEITGNAKDKLTHAGIYGVDRSVATLSELYDVPIEFYARVNFTSMITMVDALGGVDVYSNQSFLSRQHKKLPRITVEKGMNHFNGEEALVFARERYNIKGGDFQRGKNQQELIKSMMQKLMSPAILTGAMELLGTISENVDTNMTTAQIQELVKDQLDKGEKWSLKMVAATGRGDRQMCYSYSGNSLYVCQPDYALIDKIKVDINTVLDGGTLENAQYIG